MELQVPSFAGVNDGFALRIDDVSPGETVSVQLEARDAKHRQWNAAATFRADERGVVDLATSLPEKAQWEPASDLGILWNLATPVAEYAEFAVDPSQPVPVDIKVRSRAQGMGATQKRFLNRAAQRDERGAPAAFEGEVWAPTSRRSPRAIVVLLPDATGAPGPAAAAELAASAGTVCAWWAPAPDQRGCCDANRLLAGITELRQQYRLPLALVGAGTGANLAITLAAGLRDLAAVVAHSPHWARVGTLDTASGVALRDSLHCDFGPDQPLEIGWVGARTAWRTSWAPRLLGRPRQLGGLYSALPEPGQPEAGGAALPIDAVRVPLLLTAGEDDEVWDAPAMLERLTASAQVDVAHVIYRGAGHGVAYPFALPGLPNPGVAGYRGTPILIGGTRVANGQAAVTSREHLLGFLSDALGGGQA